MSCRRVVITGLGWVTSLGLGVDEVWKKLVNGESGIKPITRFDTGEYSTKIAGEISDWDGGPNLEKRVAKRLDRFAQFALNAAIDAVNESGLDFSREDPWRCGSIIGSGVGGIEEFADGHLRLLNKGPGRVSPFMVPKLMCNAGSGNVSIYYGLKGPNTAVATACASGGHAISDATDAIRRDTADIMVTGGSEAALTPLGLACFAALKALSNRNEDPPRASRPFDAERDGFVLAEGSGIIVLEEYEHARQRGAKIYAELLGHGQSADGTHITAPDERGRGGAFAMESAIRDANIRVEEIDYVNAHATSTPLGDLAETRAVKRLFADHAWKVPINSTKSMTGHPLGASGGIEAVITAKAIETGTCPPTTNLEHADPDCDLDYVPNEARSIKIQVGMTNSFGFGGHNVSLVLGKL